MARQGKIIEILGTTTRLWVNMFHLEGKVEDTLWCVTVLAPIRRAFSNRRISCVHGCVVRIWRSVRVTVASTSASISASSSMRSSGVSAKRRSSNVCIRSY